MRTDGLNRYLHDIPSQISRIHFLLNCTWLSRIDQILGHKSNLHKFKNIEIILSIFSDHNAEIRHQLQGKTQKRKHTETKQYTSNQQKDHYRNQRENKKYLETNDNKNTLTQNLLGGFVQLLSHVWLSATPWTVACQASLSFTVSWILLKLMSIESVMPSNHLILCPLLSIFPSIRAFSNESALCIRLPKY